MTEKNEIEVLANRVHLHVPLDSIAWIDTCQNAVLLHTDSGVIKTYMTFTRMKELLDRITSQFLTCYKGCVVNMNRVARIDGLDFIMEDGTRIQVRKRDGSRIRRSWVQYRLAKSSRPASLEAVSPCRREL